MDPIEMFSSECRNYIKRQAEDQRLNQLSNDFLRQTFSYRYPYNFSFLGRPIIQYPQDIIAIQELIWQSKPDLIIETGIAHGGSLIMSAAMLALIDLCDSLETGTTFNPRCGRRKVVGVDIDIRPHNRRAIESHPISGRIEMLEGSSVDAEIIGKIHAIARSHSRVMVCLDSNHTHEHVLAELSAYAPLTSPGCYCVVFDTIIENLPDATFPDRSWGIGNNPMTAVREFLRVHPEFEIDKSIENKLLVTVCPDGFLRRRSS
jgi:cephalosporin hydroxylase